MQSDLRLYLYMGVGQAGRGTKHWPGNFRTWDRLTSSVSCLIGQVILYTHLLDLGTLYFGPIHMPLLHLENLKQQIGCDLVGYFMGQANGAIIGRVLPLAHRPDRCSRFPTPFRPILSGLSLDTSGMPSRKMIRRMSHSAWCISSCAWPSMAGSGEI